jgi:hypothetical protein
VNDHVNIHVARTGVSESKSESESACACPNLHSYDRSMRSIVKYVYRWKSWGNERHRARNQGMLDRENLKTGDLHNQYVHVYGELHDAMPWQC